MGMTDTYIHKIYTVADQGDQREAYDDWADSYDDDLGTNSYKTPTRIAEALKQCLPADQTHPRILDWACGTGLSGSALQEAGFKDIDGCDISEGMLEKARAKGLYNKLFTTPLGVPDPAMFKDYDVVAAVGAVSVGAAPAECLPAILDGLKPGARLAVSFNALTLDDKTYMDTLAKEIERDDVSLEFSEDGPHLTAEHNSKSRVMVLKKS